MHKKRPRPWRWWLDNQIHRHDPPVHATTSSQTNSAKRMVLRICTLTFSNFNVRTWKVWLWYETSREGCLGFERFIFSKKLWEAEAIGQPPEACMLQLRNQESCAIVPWLLKKHKEPGLLLQSTSFIRFSPFRTRSRICWRWCSALVISNSLIMSRLWKSIQQLRQIK